MIRNFERATADWPDERVRVERFIAQKFAVDPDAKPYTIALARSQAEVPVRAGQSMLAALQEFGIAVPTSCCGGICSACKVGWLDGKPVHGDRILSPYERKRYLMVCVAGFGLRPAGARPLRWSDRARENRIVSSKRPPPWAGS